MASLVERMARGGDNGILAIARSVAPMSQAREVIDEALRALFNDPDRKASRVSRLIRAGIQ